MRVYKFILNIFTLTQTETEVYRIHFGMTLSVYLMEKYQQNSEVTLKIFGGVPKVVMKKT